MSDHEVSKPAQAHDVDDAVAAAPAEGAVEPTAAEEPTVSADTDAAPDHAAVAQSANETLAEAARAAERDAGTTAPAADEHEAAKAEPGPAESARTESTGEKPAAPADPDLAAFDEAEASYPGTFGGTFTPAPPRAEPPVDTTVKNSAPDAPTQVIAPAPMTTAPAAATEASPLPIFVQAPEAPRERGNRGAIFGIGLLAALCFAVLYLGTALGIAALNGKVASDSIGTFLQNQALSAGLWLPVLLFAIGFWLLGAIINRGRWGFWVVFGIIVGVFAYAGHILGAIGSVQFWKLGPTELGNTANAQLLAPLAIAAFIFGRELTIWFGAWAARTGARRTAQNAEAQREYERILEAGPTLSQ